MNPTFVIVPTNCFGNWPPSRSMSACISKKKFPPAPDWAAAVVTLP